MKFILIFLFALISVNNCYAKSIAIEFQEKGKFTGIIGKAHLTDNSIEIVTFAENDGEIIPFAWIYKITEKQKSSDKVQILKCMNQLGVISSGYLDFSDSITPRLNIASENGVSITNISASGRKMKNKYIPNVDLGN